jgi:hypothetical protein
MGLYDGKSGPSLNFRFDFDWRKAKYPVLGVGALAVLILLILLVMLAVAPKPLEAKLEPNPLDISLDREKVSYLTVTVTNTTPSLAQNVVVSVEAKAFDTIDVFPNQRVISTLESGKSRILDPFAVSPKPNTSVYSGTYSIVVTTSINGQESEKEVVLELKTA